MSAGSSWSGSIPAWLSRPRRRGEPDARTSLGRPIISTQSHHVMAITRNNSLEAVGNAALGQIVGRHLDQHLVACEHADAVLAHAARRVRDDLVLVLELDAEG